jgi:hypothetical protein
LARFGQDGHPRRCERPSGAVRAASG